MREDDHEKAALDRVKDLGSDAAFLTIALALLLAGVWAVPTWFLALYAVLSAAWNIGVMVWHLLRSRTALKGNGNGRT